MRRERANSIFEIDAEARTAKLQIFGSSFEQRIVSLAVGEGKYEAAVRIHDNKCRIYASIHVPQLPMTAGERTIDDVAAHNELVERAAIIMGRNEIRALKVDISSEPGMSGYSSDYFSSRTSNADFLQRRAEIIGLPELAGALIQQEQKASLGAFFRGLFKTRAQVADRLLRATDITQELELMQDIYEHDRSRRQHNFHIYFQDLAWNCRQYQRGLSFVFEGQRGEVEESLNAVLGTAPLRRIKYQAEIEREQRDVQEALAKALDTGRACGYCHKGFEKGTMKVYDELAKIDGKRGSNGTADFHLACYNAQKSQVALSQSKA